jgi:hypothetical protein
MSRKRLGLRPVAGLATFVSVVAVALFIVPSAFATGNAGYTTFDTTLLGCLDNPTGVDCNNYAAKEDVFANGGPLSGPGLDDGTYYFAVLVPGYQHDGFIDGHKGNLSDTTVGGTTGDTGSGDAYTNREFTVSGGAPTFSGTHALGTSNNGSTIVQLSPYDDTSNGGGVYILAICSITGGYPPAAKDCKFDAFRINGEGVNTASDLTVSKDANPTFTRTFGWTVDKTVDGQPSVSYNQTGSSRILQYQVVYTKDGGADTAWDVQGTITVTNPNSTAVTGVDLTDQITYDNGGTPTLDVTCTVTGGSNQTIPANSAVDFSYDCSYTSAPAASSETNTATATWDATANGTPTGTASFDLPFSWGDPSTVVHDCVVASDNNPGNVTSGTAPTGTICDTTTFTYQVTVSVPNRCVDNNNTAGFADGTYTGSDSTTAHICRVPPNTGALTMGFWQNKNGQGIIKSFCGGTSGTSLYAFLTSFNPFKDLTSSTCSGEALYVYNVVKAATCSGPSTAPCNAMLKAQDLATSLNVYFSDPALGGNKINAPNGPIGNFKIDLTQICVMIDGSGGTATCSGTYVSASSAFNGATCLFVYKLSDATDILRYAASQASSGGTPWYGTSKTLQVLAKNVFDAINNKVAFSCP